MLPALYPWSISNQISPEQVHPNKEGPSTSTGFFIVTNVDKLLFYSVATVTVSWYKAVFFFMCQGCQVHLVPSYTTEH